MPKRSLKVMFVALAVFAGLCAQVATAAEPARPRQLDLTYVTADVCGVVVLHPQQMARSPEMAAAFKNEHVVTFFGGLSVDPLKIEQVQVLIPVPPEKPVLYGGRSLVLRFSPPVDTDNAAKLMLGKPREPRKIVTATVAGRHCYTVEDAIASGVAILPPTITCAADDRTVLVWLRGEAELKKMLAGGEVKSPLVERLRRLDVSDDIVAVFVLEPMRESIKEDLARQRQFSPASPGVPFNEIALLLKSATVKADLSDDARTSAVLEAEDAAGAAKVEELLKTLLQAAKDDLVKERKRLEGRPEEFRKLGEPMMSAVEEVLDAMTWTRSAAQVTVSLNGNKGLMGKWFATSALAFVMPIPARPNSPEDERVAEPAPSTRPPPRKSPKIEKD